MTEAEARAALNVSRETYRAIDTFLDLLRDENSQQNLVSRLSLDHLWSRHVLDSTQLLRFAPGSARTWLDLGSGAGFPGLIVALLRRGEVTLVESRKLRADFLNRVIHHLGLATRAAVICAKIENFRSPPFDVISARAFAPLEKTLALGAPFATAETRWILPKGRNAKSELEAARTSWQGDFRIEPSLTDPASGIVVAEGVRRRIKGRAAR